MRCSRCGSQIGNSYVRFNGVLLCDSCARDLKIDEVFRRQNALFDQAFPMLDEFPGVFSSGSDLDFANAKIRCPRCGTTLRELESGGQLGCIECYNTFNESITKNILKLQGSSEYMGRKPAQASEIEASEAPVQEAEPEKKTEPKAAAKPAAKAEAKAEAKTEDILAKVKDADLSELTDKEIEDAMKKAAEVEDYALAVKLRDELKSRKGEN
ncbi:MAG: UvrB/UvrC motif-containing protein [Clostridiales bacterium]|nr:UvrB/UvrC motif-containing protein [Clostridiales bacterium]